MQTKYDTKIYLITRKVFFKQVSIDHLLCTELARQKNQVANQYVHM